MAITFTYTESTNKVVQTEGTSGTPATFADFVTFDRTAATTACTIASGAELKAAATIGADTDLTLTYPVRPVENKALRLAVTTAQGDTAVSGDETIDIFGTTCVWHAMTGASASGQKVVPIANGTHNYQVGDTVILIDISAPSTYETDTIAAITEGVSITMTNNNTNAYATGDIVGIYQTEQIDSSAAHATYWTTVPYGQIAMLTFTGYAGTNTGKVDQPIWGVIWDYGSGQYEIDSLFTVGDGSTTTYFVAEKASVVFNEKFQSLVASNLRFGTKGTNNTYNSCFIQSNFDGAFWDDLKGTLIEFYSTTWLARTGEPRYDLGPGQLEIQDFVTEGKSRFWISGDNSSGNIKRLRQRNAETGVYNVNGTICTDIINEDCVYGLSLSGAVDGAIIENLVAAGATYQTLHIAWSANKTFYLRDCTVDNWADRNYGSSVNPSTVYRQYTCNIHVADKDGNDLESVTVLCEEQDGTDAFSVSTDSNGDITEQNINYIKWYYTTSEAETVYSPHKFTLSKPGYETLVLDNITLDGPVDWHLELQPKIKLGIESGGMFIPAAVGQRFLTKV